MLPIPINEKELIKLGFKKNDNKYVDNYIIKAGDWTHSVGYDDEDMEWIYYNDYLDSPNYRITYIKYIHELQNLYFALTGEELTYNC